MPYRLAFFRDAAPGGGLRRGLDHCMNRFVSPKELATSIGASESSLKRWVDNGHLEVTRTAGGHRRIPINEAVRFIRDRGLHLVRPDVLGLAPSLDLTQEAHLELPMGKRLSRLLIEGRMQEARGLIMALFMEGMTVAEIADGPIATAFEEIGELWHHSETGIIIEHRATEAIIYAINVIRPLLEVDPGETSLTAIGCSLSGDPYILPPLLAAVSILELGFRSIALGPDLPFRVLANEVKRLRPELIWLSTSLVPDPKGVSAMLAELGEEVASWGGLIVLGGREAHLLDYPESPAIQSCSSMQGLVEVAGWIDRTRRSDDTAA